MKTFVIDTNVVVSAYLSPHGKPAEFLSALISKRFRVAYDARILAEYVEVLRRPRIGVTPDEINDLLEIMNKQDFLSPVSFDDSSLPDESDKMFMEVALATKDKLIVTGNAKHYPTVLMKKLEIRIVSPAEALELLMHENESSSEKVKPLPATPAIQTKMDKLGSTLDKTLKKRKRK